MRSPVPSGATVGPEPGTQVDRKVLSVKPIPPAHSYHPASFARASALRAGSVYTSAWCAMALFDGRTSIPSTQRSVVLPGSTTTQANSSARALLTKLPTGASQPLSPS